MPERPLADFERRLDAQLVLMRTPQAKAAFKMGAEWAREVTKAGNARLREERNEYQFDAQCALPEAQEEISRLEGEIERLHQLLYTFFYTKNPAEYQLIEMELIQEAKAKIDA